MRLLKWLMLAALALALLLPAAGQAGLLRGHAPDDLGVHDGKLKPPSNTPNSVSSQADLWPGHPQRDAARIAPLTGVGIARLRSALAGWPGARIVSARDDYLQVEFTTPLLHFTDDAEFWFDPAARVVQVRSASRLGHGDLGTNRRRIEALRRQLAATP